MEKKIRQYIDGKFDYFPKEEIEILINSLDNEKSDEVFEKQKKISFKLIKDLLINTKDVDLTHGLSFNNIFITGYLNLECVNINFPLSFCKCTFEQGINLKLSNLRSLSFYRSTVNGCVNLDSALIDGQLNCGGAFFNNPYGDAFIGKEATITKSVFFNTAVDDNEKDKQFEAQGTVDLEGIKISGKLDCGGGKFTGIENRKAFTAENALIEEDVLMNEGFNATGEVNLGTIRVTGGLICSNASFRNPNGYAFISHSSIIKGSVFLNEGFSAEGGVNLQLIRINGQLNCRNAAFKNPNGYALLAQSAIIDESLFMNDGFNADGEVNLLGAKIYGTWDCQSGKFNNPNGFAIYGKRIIVKRDVYFMKPKEDKDVWKQPFIANGTVKLCGAKIGGELKCSSGIFNNPTEKEDDVDEKMKCAFIAKGLIATAVFFDEKFHAKGIVRLTNASIDGPLIIKDVQKDTQYRLILESTYVRSLDDNKDGWPEKGKLVLKDFIYDNIEYNYHKPKDRIVWLKLNNGDHNLQPYRHLANVLENKGWENEARDIRIAMNMKLKKDSHKKWQRIWLGIYEALSSFGYKPFKVWKIAMILWLLGYIFYDIGNQNDLMQPPENSTPSNKTIVNIQQHKKLYEHYPICYPLIYSLDVLLPIVDLHQEEYWRPSQSIKTCNVFYYLLLLWMYIQIAAGWILTTMLVGGITGLIQKK